MSDPASVEAGVWLPGASPARSELTNIDFAGSRARPLVTNKFGRCTRTKPPLAVLTAAVVFLFCPALVLALFLMSLLPETLLERQARLWVAGRLRECGHGPPAE